MKRFLIASMAWLALALTGCATASRAPSQAQSNSEYSGPTAAQSRVLVEEILSADKEIEPAPHSEVPIEINESVQNWIDYFSIRDRERFARFLERGLRYKELVHSILREYQVPREMYYLAMIESGYVTHAKSRAKAVGAWQFMPATGKRYGLKRNSYLDERRDIVRATHAAAQYLKDLHDEFNSWYLAMAAYNAGEGRIRGAIRRGKSRDFWALVKKRALPRETMHYVPKFLAAVIIGKDLPKYGFTGIKEEKLPTLKQVAVPPSVHLRAIAVATETSLEEMRGYNPHLIRDITPRGRHSYSVWVPEERASRLAEVAEALPRHAAPMVTRSTRQPRKTRIARKASKTRKARVLASADRGRKAKRTARPRVHRVRRGDTLISIANRYSLSVTKLRKINGLKSTRIYLGQSLRVHPKQI